MKKVKLKINGMHCTSCAMNIDFDLEDIGGVNSSNTSYARSECEVEFDESKVAIETLFQSVQNTGYSAELKSEKG